MNIERFPANGVGVDSDFPVDHKRDMTMKKQRIQLTINDFPGELHPYLFGVDIYDSSCHSNAQTLYLSPNHYLKIDAVGELAREAALTEYFHDRRIGVEVVSYISSDRDYLLTQAAAGEDLTHWCQDPKALCQILAETLRYLHSQPIDQAPVSHSYEHYLDAAAGDMGGGSYDESVAMDRFSISSKEEAWQVMQENKHRLKADTLIHGDYCLPNIIYDVNGKTTLIDLALGGIGDRHIDLYWAVWSLEYNLGTDRYTDYFLDCYGRENFDYDMLRVIAAFEIFG